MSTIELAKKYIKDASCKHCEGSGKCICNSCRSDQERNYMMVWTVRNPQPLAYMLSERDAWQEKYHKELEKSKEWAKTIDTCPRCGGKGLRPEIDNQKLNKEVEQGIITEHEKYAILKEIGKVFGASYFQY